MFIVIMQYLTIGTLWKLVFLVHMFSCEMMNCSTIVVEVDWFGHDESYVGGEKTLSRYCHIMYVYYLDAIVTKHTITHTCCLTLSIYLSFTHTHARTHARAHTHTHMHRDTSSPFLSHTLTNIQTCFTDGDIQDSVCTFMKSL